MNIFLVVDNDVDLREFDRTFQQQPGVITLFPLTSNFIMLDKLQRHLSTYPYATVNVVDSAILINAEVDRMRESIHDWSYQLGNASIKNKKLKDWLIFPDQGGVPGG